MSNTRTPQEVVSFLNSQKGSSISKNDHPLTIEVLSNLLYLHGFSFNEDDFGLLLISQDIDDDGKPFILRRILIFPVNVVVDIIAKHNHEWDFFIKDVSLND